MRPGDEVEWPREAPVREPAYRNPRYAAALLEQTSLRERLEIRSLPSAVRFVAGADVSCGRFDRTAWGGMVVCDLVRGLQAVDRAVVRTELEFPYLPGLLAFREVPVLAAAFARLEVRPDVVLCDAHGTAHPRRFGEAAHLGVVLGIPSVGCAKSLLCGAFEEPARERGARAPILWDGRWIGEAVRTRAGVSPVFVSPGHRCDLPSAVALVLSCAPRWRIPEPIRLAHALVNEARRAGGG